MEIGTDITKQKLTQARLEVAIRESTTLLSTFEMHSIVSVADRAGTILEVNDAFCDISGYARDELLGQNHRILNSGTHSAAFWESMWADIAVGKSWRADVCNRTKDGRHYWVDNIITPFMGDDGFVERYVSIRNDISARKEAELALSASQAFLDRAGQIAGVGGWRVDLITGDIHWSNVTKTIHEVPTDYQPLMEDALSFYPPESRIAIERAIAALHWRRHRMGSGAGYGNGQRKPDLGENRRRKWNCWMGKPLHWSARFRTSPNAVPWRRKCRPIRSWCPPSSNNCPAQSACLT